MLAPIPGGEAEAVKMARVHKVHIMVAVIGAEYPSSVGSGLDYIRIRVVCVVI